MDNTNNNSITPEVDAAVDSHHSSHHSSSHHHSSHEHSSSSHHSSHKHSSSSHSHSSHNSSPSTHHSSSHHSSSKHSASKRKKKKKRDKFAVYSKWRKVFSFLLFISLSVTTVCAGLKITVLNENRILDIFTNNSYIEALQNDVLEYSTDLCAKCAIPEDSVKDVITFENVLDVQKAYTYGNIKYDEMYSATTYTENLNAINKELVSSTNEMLRKNGLKLDESKKNEDIKAFADDITSYIQGRVEFAYATEIQSVINISNTVANVALVLFSVFSVAFLLLTLSLTEKKYRALRSLCFSLFATADFNLALVISIGIVAIFKDFVIYPEYLCQSVLSYVGSCVVTYLIVAALMFMTGLCVSSVAWKEKRNNE